MHFVYEMNRVLNNGILTLRRPTQVHSIIGISATLSKERHSFSIQLIRPIPVRPIALFVIYCLSHFSSSFNATTDTMYDKLPQKRESSGCFSYSTVQALFCCYYSYY